jgi:hypothetical protein
MPIKRKVVVRYDKVYTSTYVPKTVGDEVEWLVAQWYETLGQPIPAEEMGIGRKIDEIERQRFNEELQIVTETPMEVFEENVKPEFGTPAFWAWARKQRAEKNAERAAQGLPPLPTKKEKEAAKEARAKERSAAKAAKAAKVLEKLKKAEEKAVKKTK